MVTVGEIIDGVVTGVMSFGAFVDIGDNRSGLVHISEVSNEYVEDISKHLKKGDKVKVKILEVDAKGKINLSIKKALPEKSERVKKERVKPAVNARPDDFDWAAKKDDELSFEDKLSKFKKISDENMQAIRSHNESKRSGGYSRKGNY